MKTRQFLMIVLVVGVLFSLVTISQAQEPAGQPEGYTHNVPPDVSAAGPGYELDDIGLMARPTGLLSYQGQLLQNGTTVNGPATITFRLYTSETGGSPWWEETRTVQVQEGLFNVMLGEVVPLDDRAVSFQSQQWLGVQPQGASVELTPRQPLSVVAYTMNVMPGATMVDENTGGIYMYSFYVDSFSHPAIYGWSGSSRGITGSTSADSAAGVYGYSSGDYGHGVSGQNYGSSTSCPPGAAECAAGVYGTASGDAYAGFLYGENRSALIDVVDDNGYYGLWVYTLGVPNGNGIWTNGASYFGDYVTFGGGKSGYVVDIALNDGTEPLEQGDVVVISGYDTPVIGNVPVVRVRRAAIANATGVIGVVDTLYVPCTASEPLEAGQGCGGFETGVTQIEPGEYLGVVTLGAYHSVKVSAFSGPIQPGDLLTTSTSTGYAAKSVPLQVEGVSFHPPGTIVGKALGRADKGVEVIPIFVSAR